MNTINFDEKIMIIRLKDNIEDPQELYERTRKSWRVSLKRANQAEYVLSMYRGIVNEIYKVYNWQLDAGENSRYEFSGDIAEAAVRNKYLDMCLKDYFKKGQSNPITYVNIKK